MPEISRARGCWASDQRKTRRTVGRVRGVVLSMLATVGLLSIASAAQPVASSLLVEGVTQPSHSLVVGTLACPAASHGGRYAVIYRPQDQPPHRPTYLWGSYGGSPEVLLVAEPGGLLPQAAFEAGIGIDDSGRPVYSALLAEKYPGLGDSVWRENVPDVSKGSVAQGITPRRWWRWISRAGVTAGGEPFWLGGLASTGSNIAPTSRTGLFYGMTAAPLLLSGNLVSGLSAPLAGVGPDFAISYNGGWFISQVRLAAGSASDEAVVLGSNGEVFYTLKEAKVLVEKWRMHYNTARPHSSLGYLPPAPEAIVAAPGAEPDFAALSPALHRGINGLTLTQRLV